MSELHEGLTTHHDSFVGHTYLEDPQLRFAYDAYMLCVQSPKLIPILDAVKSRLIPCRGPLHVADIGCGTATAAIAASLWMSDNTSTWNLRVSTNRIRFQKETELISTQCTAVDI